MKLNSKFFAFLAVIFLAAAFRLPDLSRRPMHTDEAVHGIKFGALLENNDYKYDPVEYHGPTLNYFTLIPAWIGSAKTIKNINETTLRIVPAFFGILIIGLFFFLSGGLGLKAVSISALFAALSPAMIFYSRYYIQEMLLVCFSFAVIVFGYRYLQTQNFRWAGLAGIFAGLMFANKETSVITFGSIFLALTFTYIKQKGQKKTVRIKEFLARFKLWQIIFAILSAIVISALFYSSFFSNPKGILDSLLTYKTYFHRAGQIGFHIHPFYYYFNLLIYSKNAGGTIWSEGIIIIFAAIGIISVFFAKQNQEYDINLARFIAFYTIIITVIYCAIPYKTPWSMLSFYFSMILTAGIGFIKVIQSQNKYIYRLIFIPIIILGFIHLGWQSYQLNFKYCSDPQNPYTYSHPGPDVLEIAGQMEKIADSHPDKYDLYIQVIVPGADYWPLPWYLRSFNNVGWWNKVDEDVPSAPIIIVSPDLENRLIRKLYELPPPGERSLYIPLFDSYKELRPGIEIRGYIQNDLWRSTQE